MLKYVNFGVVFSEIPDETTLSINISNCPIHCLGCHSNYLWEDIGEILDTHAIDDFMKEYRGSITCICFMGGDAHPEAINKLARHIKAKYKDMKVGWYSGRQNISSAVSILNLDYLKLGPYNQRLGGLSEPTTNQRLYKIDKYGITTDITKRIWEGKKRQ